jgi:hypothetical protein
LYNNQWNGKKNRNDQSLLHGKALQPNANAIMPRVLLVSSPFGANMPKKAPKRDGGHRQNDPMLMVCPQPTNYRGAIITCFKVYGPFEIANKQKVYDKDWQKIFGMGALMIRGTIMNYHSQKGFT